MTVDERRKQILARFIRQVWDKGDADAVEDFLGETYTIAHDPGDEWDGQTLDLDGFKDRLLRSRAAFPDQVFDIQGLFADGDRVVMS